MRDALKSLWWLFKWIIIGVPIEEELEQKQPTIEQVIIEEERQQNVLYTPRASLIRNVTCSTDLVSARKTLSTSSPFLKKRNHSCLLPSSVDLNDVSAYKSLLYEKGVLENENWISKVKAQLLQIAAPSKIQEALSKEQEQLDKDLDERMKKESKRTLVLPENASAVIKKALSRPSSEVLIEKFNIEISSADLDSLRDKNWLNDNVINFYMELLRDRNPTCHVFNTFFYPSLKEHGYQKVRRWTRRVDVFSFAKILIPIHLGMHWTLAVVDFGAKQIGYYDSMSGTNHTCTNIIKDYLHQECLDKKQKEFDFSLWSIKFHKNIPQQSNGYDCGVFTLVFADYVAADKSFDFSQSQMPFYRKKITFEILNGKLL